MNRRFIAIVSLLVLCVSLVSCKRAEPPATAAADLAKAASVPAATPASVEPQATEADKKPPVDFEQLAQRLVANAGVKEGEIVLVAGQMQDAELLEDIAVNVRKAGAFPLVEYGSDRLSKRLFFDVPEKYDAQTDAAGMKLAGVVNAIITVSDSMTEDLFDGADPDRLATRGKANEAVGKEFIKRNVRTVELGNGFYPTAWRAARYQMPQGDLSKMFWEGVNVDFADLQTRGEQVRTALAAGNELHISNPNGTDFKVRVQARPVLVSDGVISAEDMKKGGASVAVYLPAGEVYTTPVPGTAEGKIIHTKDFYRGKQIDNLTLIFVAGKLASMSGSGPGYAEYKADYDAVPDARKDLFGFVDLGINPNVKLPASSQVGSWVPAGTITVGTGNNTWAGGDNSVSYGMTVYLPGSTVMLDGKAIIENGELKI